MSLTYKFIRNPGGDLFGAVSSDGTQIGIGSQEWDDARAWNSIQPTPDDLQPRPPALLNPPAAYNTAVGILKQYMALQQPGTSAQMDKAIQSICVVLKTIIGELNQ